MLEVLPPLRYSKLFKSSDKRTRLSPHDAEYRRNAARTKKIDSHLVDNDLFSIGLIYRKLFTSEADRTLEQQMIDALRITAIPGIIGPDTPVPIFGTRTIGLIDETGQHSWRIITDEEARYEERAGAAIINLALKMGISVDEVMEKLRRSWEVAFQNFNFRNRTLASTIESPRLAVREQLLAQIVNDFPRFTILGPTHANNYGLLSIII